MAKFKTEAAADGVLGSGPVQVTPYAAQHVLKIDFPIAGQGNDAQALNSLDTLRRKVLPSTLGAIPHTTAVLGGSLAFSTDFNGQLDHRILPVFLFVLGVTFLLMLIAFRSWVIAATAIVLNLLSTGAAYGVMVAVFQHGWGAGLVGTKPVGALESWIPLFVFVVLFGLSMDYHVFVVSRIREAHDRGLSTKDAVAHGLRATAGTVTSAAAIMVAVFGVFGTLSTCRTSELGGVGLGVAEILLDATVIRRAASADGDDAARRAQLASLGPAVAPGAAADRERPRPALSGGYHQCAKRPAGPLGGEWTHRTFVVRAGAR